MLPSLLVGVLLAAALIVTTPIEAAAQGNDPIVVDSVGDSPDANPGDGRCRTASNLCSLRAAIDTANANPGPDRIVFAITNGGNGQLKRINLTSPLPSLHDPSGGTVIDGYTQPGAAPNTHATRFTGSIKVEIDGVDEEPNSAITIESAENQVRGLSIFSAGNGIELKGAGAQGNRIVGNIIGTDTTATHEQVEGGWIGVGVIIQLGASQNTVGTADVADRNVISGNGRIGVRINHGPTTGNVVQNNILGLTPDGTRNLSQRIGVDLQWWTWGNLIGGPNPGDGNVASGNQNGSGGIDLSHHAVDNIVMGNFVGTSLDRVSVGPHTANTRGVALKDGPLGNQIIDNVIGNSLSDGIWNEKTYNGRQLFYRNRIGVAANGADIGNQGAGVMLRGYDNWLHSNIIANNAEGGIVVSDAPGTSRYPDTPVEQTIRNRIVENTIYRSGGTIELLPVGHNPADPTEQDGGPNLYQPAPTMTGLRPGELYGTTCGGCRVDVFVRGALQADGSLVPAIQGGIGRVWLGSAVADGQGRFSLADAGLATGVRLWLTATDPTGNSSELSRRYTVTADGVGDGSNPQPSVGSLALPPLLPLPEPYQPRSFSCSADGGRLAWDDAGAAEYYVFAINGGVESYLGAQTGTELEVRPADGYRVEHWADGPVVNARCDGPGRPMLECSFSGGTLSWTDAGADRYYVFAETDGIETYLGAHTGRSIPVPPADGYRVEHWADGPVSNALCGGSGGGFGCSVDGTTLSWDDAGAAEYYIFAYANGNEIYLGGHSTTSLEVDHADSYRVEHWLTGRATNARC